MSISTAYVEGIEAVQAHVRAYYMTEGEPGSISVEGLQASAAKELRIRVREALVNSGVELPDRPLAIAFFPPCTHSSTSGLDLPAALAVVELMRQDPPLLTSCWAYASLGLNGELRGARGVVPVAARAAQEGVSLLVSDRDGDAASLGYEGTLGAALLAGSLREILGNPAARVDLSRLRMRVRPQRPTAPSSRGPDFADCRLSDEVRYAITIAAAGRHSLLLRGPAGSGKTMIARRLPGILPPLSDDEALEVAAVQSAAGLDPIGYRPFRAPHHSVTPAALVGGGAGMPRPGEVSLAHRGVLFLDELAEFSAAALDALGGPIRNGSVQLSRASRSITLPSEVEVCVMAANNCPCGRSEDRCRCEPRVVDNYRKRLDKLSQLALIKVDVEHIPVEDDSDRVSSADFAEVVAAARAIITDERGVEITPEAEAEMGRDSSSPGRYSKVVRVSRTVAAVDGRAEITASDVKVARKFVGGQL